MTHLIPESAVRVQRSRKRRVAASADHECPPGTKFGQTCGRDQGRRYNEGVCHRRRRIADVDLYMSVL